jgi:uncharacterized surface protein with fasciclin (FAS1) repeats
MKKALMLVAFSLTMLMQSNLSAQQTTIAQTAINAGNFNTLVAALKAAGLVDTFNGGQQFTVFAPTDDAFAKLDPAMVQNLLRPENQDQLKQVLTYHAVSGRVGARDAYDLNSAATVNGQRLSIDFKGNGLKVNESLVKVADIQCTNGVIHVIDTVLIPKLDNIPATATSAGKFQTLLAAVGAAGLGDVLSGPGPFTVFAPTDAAFSALPQGTVESLLKPENKQKLIDILKYHVVSGRVYDNDAAKAGRATSLLGRSLNVTVSAGGLMVNKANVVVKNIEASNGVIHVVDQVLIPSSMSSQDVVNSLNAAINQGAPIFNSGHHAQCCDIYMNTLQGISSGGFDSDANSMSIVNTTLANARGTHDMTERAWVLRRGMDQLMVRAMNMNTMPMTTTASPAIDPIQLDR